jgi:hypothetical protein
MSACVTSTLPLTSHVIARAVRMATLPTPMYVRGSRNCAQYAFRLIENALLQYSERVPGPAVLGDEQLEYIERVKQLFSPEAGSKFAETGQRLRDGFAAEENRRENVRFFDALARGLAGITQLVEEEQETLFEEERYGCHDGGYDDGCFEEAAEEGYQAAISAFCPPARLPLQLR